MRIIAGTARGRRILSVPKSLPVRPISARIKQSVFDIIRPRLPGSRFLDLFAGTGAVGLEALSRGAEKVVFVDGDRKCVEVIGKNLERVGWKDRGQTFHADLLQPLSWIAFRSRIEAFDLIFMGPPYKDREKRPLTYTQTMLDNLAAAKLLAPDGWLLAQHFKKEPVKAPAGFEKFRESKYGDTTVSFFRWAGYKRSELASQ